MMPFGFRPNRLFKNSPKISVSTVELLSPNVTHRDDDIVVLAERLENLAVRINAFNTSKKRTGFATRPFSGYLPSFGKFLAKEQHQIASTCVVESNFDTSTGLDAEGRIWPQLLPAQQLDIQALENKIAEQSAELTRRYIQIADLSNIRQEQANELLTACDEIDCLSKSIAELQQALAQRDAEAATATEKHILLEKDNLALQVHLNKALHESIEFSKRLLDAEITLNKTVVDLAATQEAVEQKKIEIVAIQSEALRVGREIEEKIDRRYRDELGQQRARFENQIGDLRNTVAERDRKIEDIEAGKTELASHFECLSNTAATFEAAQQSAKTEIECQAERIKFLETQLKFERKTSQANIEALIAEFQQERMEQYAKEQASAEIRKDIFRLLPKIAARRNEPYAPEQFASISRDNAA